MCARLMLLMRNGFAHITSSESLFKTRPPKILNHPKRRKKRRKKTFGLFLSPSKKKGLFRSFCLLFLVFLFLCLSFPDLFIHLSRSSSSSCLLLLQRERERKREEKRETQYENSRRASRETRPLSSPRRFEEEKEQRDLIHFNNDIIISSPYAALIT